MKKSVKRKTDRYIQFRNRTNSANYRDKKAIIAQFNKSVREYKRFSEVYSAGDEELASAKLHDAGTDLYMCCEWALKNYLYRMYDEQFVTHIISSIVREHKIDQLSTKTATIGFLLEELKDIGIPSPVVIGINSRKIIENAQIVNNGPKHDRKIPDPNRYKESLEEVRKIIKNYVDENVELELIDDSLYGGGKAWYEILEDTSEFNSAYSYVLITRRIDSNDIRGLFSQKWDLVIDMDPDSDINGLAYKYTDITGIVPTVCTLDAINARRKFSFSHRPYWIMANGTSDVSDSVVDPKRWGTAHGKYLSSILEEFHKEYSKPVKAFVYPLENERNLRKIVDTFNDVYDSGDEINFCVLSADSEYNSIDDENFKISTLSIEEFAEHLEKYNLNSKFISGLIKRELPAENGKRVLIDENFATVLKDSFDTVFIDIDQEDELDSEKCNRIDFYKGIQEISWYGLREHFDVIQPEQRRTVDKITQDMKDRGRLLRKVYYVPGIGGTTLMRRLAWEFREIYPTFILNRLNEQTGKNLQKIYDLTHCPILIFADNNFIEFDEVKNLQVELKRMGFAFVICYFQRKLKGIHNENEGSVYTIVRDFGIREARQMKIKLQDLVCDKGVKENFDKYINESDDYDRLPFVLSMYAFDKDFQGIKPYIANFLERMNDQSKKILFALSLADYGNVSIDIQYFMNLFNDESVDEFLLKESPGINELVRMEDISGKNFIRIRYHLFGEEILKQMSNGRNATEISFLNLVDNILGFIEDSRSNRFNINQDTLNLLRSLFITRKADVNAEKPIFSTLIMKLREEHRTSFDGSYDSSTDAIVRIFNKLVEVYPEEPHFTAHLARFYFYIDKNYEKGFRNIDSAIELSETEMGHVDPLLYHMKAMGYSSRITNIYRRDILWNFKDNPQYDTSELREKIQEDAESAFKYFKIVRDSNIGVAGHVSEINLCIQIAYLAKNMLDETDNFTEYLTSDKGKWAMQYIDRAETLWDECKQLISDSAYEDLDGIEERLHSLTVSVEDSIDIWKKYIENAGNKNCTQARRILARSYLKVAEQTKDSENKKTLYTKVIQLMEENISEENQHVGNIRIWFDSIKRIEVENQDMLIQDAIIKLNRWVNLTDSVDAHYYRFILKFIQAIEGSTLAEGELPKLLRELKHTAANKYNRTVPQHWLSKNGKGINALITNNRNRRNAVPEDEMSEILLPFIGRISNNYVNDSHAYINWHGVDVYFNPSATKGEISKINIGQRVRFGLGFSYDGPRAYNSSIKLLGKDEFVEVKREIESGIAVKCEVTKNVTHYVQVRIIGFSEIGSIYVNELVEPYSANNRPDIGTILDGKILMKKFDNAKHCNVWQITMNMNDIKEESKEETAMAQAIRLSGIKVR